MTRYFSDSDPTVNEVRLTIHQWLQDYQVRVLAELLEDLLDDFKSRGFQFAEILNSFAISAELHYSTTTGWDVVRSLINQAGDRPKCRHTDILMDKFLQACKAEKMHLIEVLDGFTSAAYTTHPHLWKGDPFKLEEACLKLIEYREPETDHEYSRVLTSA